MGWSVLGSVQHRRNRIVKTSLHFGRFLCAVCRYPQIYANILLGFERFSPSILKYRRKTCDTKEGSPPPPSSMLIQNAISLLAFRTLDVNVAHPARNTARTSLQNQHWWGRGRQNHGKLNTFDLFYWPKYSAYVLLDFPDPKTDQPIVDNLKGLHTGFSKQSNIDPGRGIGFRLIV